MTRMEITGHYHNGIIVPEDGISRPDGTEVTILLRTGSQARNDQMSEVERDRYLAALTRIDAVPNESPNDNFSGADHDRVLYGDGA